MQEKYRAKNGKSSLRYGRYRTKVCKSCIRWCARPHCTTSYGKYGLNLQTGGSTVIWFGLTWSLELYLQANARLWRQGQKETVVIHHIVTKGTIDEQVISALEKKNTGQMALIDAVKARLGGG